MITAYIPEIRCVCRLTCPFSAKIDMAEIGHDTAARLEFPPTGERSFVQYNVWVLCVCVFCLFVFMCVSAGKEL